ncbi:MAG: phage protein Gp36 family protein [Geminicoccaceae bacterium]
MSYATQADMEAAFGKGQLRELADRDGDGVADAAVVAKALADADAWIDSYLVGRYTLPLAVTPPLLNRLAGFLGFYLLHPAAVPEDVRQRYLDALAQLRDLGCGKAQLPDTVGTPTPQTGGLPKVAAGDPVFSSDTLAGF